MGPWTERSREYDLGQFKGQVYRDSAATIFVESCPAQARAIADVSGKRVICPATGEIHQ
jgi:hypothetical protein